MFSTKKISAALACVLLFSSAVLADVEVAVRGLMNNSAIVEINGKQTLLKVGKTTDEGVTLIAATREEAVLDVNGEQHIMGISKHGGIKVSEAAPKVLRIPRGNNGHFYSSGLINNRAVNFVVDTGASTIALSETEAKRLGLDYTSGPRIEVSTATTSDLGYRVNLASVSVGAIKVYNVDAVVLPGDYPQVILLGNSFLNKVNFQTDSGVLVLEAKY